MCVAVRVTAQAFVCGPWAKTVVYGWSRGCLNIGVKFELYDCSYIQSTTLFTHCSEKNKINFRLAYLGWYRSGDMRAGRLRLWLGRRISANYFKPAFQNLSILAWTIFLSPESSQPIAFYILYVAALIWGSLGRY